MKEKYTVTITNLLDLRTLQIVESRAFSTDTVIDLDLTKALYANEEGVITSPTRRLRRRSLRHGNLRARSRISPLRISRLPT